MPRVAAAGLLIAVSSFAGCSTGDDAPMPNGMSCTASLALTGSFTPDGTRPTAYDGCWGAGQWSFSASVMSNTCSDSPAITPYEFTAASEPDVNGDPIVDKFTLVSPDPGSVMNIVKLSELGAAMCEGEVDLCSTDGMKVFVLRPDITEATGNGISGQGEYLEYKMPNCPAGS